jgi:hypothetical protein
VKKEVKDKWLTALRSGEYKQGPGALRRGDEFCCLGVLCDLAVKEGVVTVQDSTPSYTGPTQYAYGVNDDAAYLPREVRDWADLPRNPHITEDGGERLSLAYFNDVGQSFDAIAALIEEHL